MLEARLDVEQRGRLVDGQPLLARKGCRRAVAAAVSLGLLVVIMGVTQHYLDAPGTTVTTTPYDPRYLMKGVGYGPAPFKQKGTAPNDDYWCERTQPLWGPAAKGNRGDLEVIASLGANTVRLYGTDPRYKHKPFLDYAAKLGLRVIPGLSDYPYVQNPEGNCKTNSCDCYEVIMEQAVMLLKSGLLQSDRSYHPNVPNICLINEAELKFKHTCKHGYQKAIVSAFDAFLSAEIKVGVRGYKPTFTATFSYGTEEAGTDFNPDSRPSIGQMVSLEQAMMNPASVGYTPQNDLAAAYKDRFVNSFNTANYARDIKPQFLEAYQEYFQDQPVYIAEFHKPGTDVSKEVEAILAIASDESNPLQGVTFFEFQKRYDKGGTETEFGLFGLGDDVVTEVPLGDSWKKFKVWCLVDVDYRGEPTSSGLSEVYGGPGVDADHLCAGLGPTQATTTSTTRTTRTTSTTKTSTSRTSTSTASSSSRTTVSSTITHTVTEKPTTLSRI